MTQRNRVKEAIAYFEDAIRETDEIITDCSPLLQSQLIEQKEHFVVAIAAMNAQEARENPQPLTLEELSKSGGKPVWIVEHPNWGHWELSEDAEDYLCDRDSDFYGMMDKDDQMGEFGLHLLGWLAYEYPPKGDRNG